MDSRRVLRRGLLPATVLLVWLSLVSCTTLSRCERDESVGMNGGFEAVRAGIPVNWLVYTPETVPEGDFDLIVDAEDFHSGRHALKFVVRQCSRTGGWHSPGFSNEFRARPGETYRIGVWVKSDGAHFVARVGGVSAFHGQYETVVEESDEMGEWTHFEHEFTMPERFEKIRFEFNVLSPGTLWVDDVTISGIS